VRHVRTKEEFRAGRNERTAGEFIIITSYTHEKARLEGKAASIRLGSFRRS
jgi:hypothetical protein